MYNLLFDGDKLDDVFMLQVGHNSELALASVLLTRADVASEHLARYQLATTLVTETARQRVIDRRPHTLLQCTFTLVVILFCSLFVVALAKAVLIYLSHL